MLADYGAEIIKVESAARPEIGRVTIFANNDPGDRYWEKGGFYAEASRNKLGVSIDLSKPDGRRLFLDLVKISDVVLENFTPRVMENFGLTYEELRKIQPDLIMFSSTGFGHDGPWRNYRAYGFSLEPTTGITFATGYPDTPPIRSIISYTDTPATYAGTFAVLAALEYRAETGKGQWIDLSQYEVGVSFVAEAAIDYQITGREEGRRANRDSTMAPHNVYRCQGNDQWLAIAVRNDSDWKVLCGVAGDPRLEDDSLYGTFESRKQRESEIDSILADWAANRDPKEAAAMLQSVGVPASLVQDSREMYFDPQLVDREFFSKVRHPDDVPGLGTRLYPGAPWVLNDGRPPIRKPAPTLGQHNREVLTGFLGIGDEELERLSGADVLGTIPHGVKKANFGQFAALPELQQTGVIRDYDPDFRERLHIDE